MMRKGLLIFVPFLLLVFAGLTLFLSSSIIFDLFGIREMEGNYFSLVVWANFLCSILYLISLYGIIRKQRWSVVLLGISSLVLITAFIELQMHISNGGLYESKTIGALIFRIVITLIFTAAAYYLTVLKMIKDEQ